ncbi:hypothetical protein CSA17_01945 [bacterium DOLJORAL78_65_58]|nr:MAG: hypothetical protein CSB20_09930 [bacterium DOLZORAL124_64_63]PIE76486.1 MAG: hypothetical protein CSA17_01945 [bacterium DOLJORAL78_65_58]
MNGQITSEMGMLTLVGVGIVFSVLALIAAVVGLFKRLDDHWQAQEAQAEQRSLDKEPTIDETTLLLISASVATVVGGRFRVRKIRRLLSPRQKRTPWSARGRLSLQGSHAITRKSK